MNCVVMDNDGCEVMGCPHQLTSPYKGMDIAMAGHNHSQQLWHTDKVFTEKQDR